MTEKQGLPLITPTGDFIICTGCRIEKHHLPGGYECGGQQVLLDRIGGEPYVVENYSWTTWTTNPPDPSVRFAHMRDAIVAELVKAATTEKPGVIDLRLLQIFQKKLRTAA